MSEVGVNPNLDHLLDPQQARVYGFCECCGRELYNRLSDLCWRCADIDIGDYHDEE